MVEVEGYGENIVAPCRVEISPHYDLWMQGARFGTVKSVTDGIATVEMDNSEVKTLQKFPVGHLIRR